MNKGTDQQLRVKSKQVFPACLPSTTPLVSLAYASVNFCGNNPMQTQKQLLTVTAQLQTKILTSINYQSKGIFELCLYYLNWWRSSCKFKVLTNNILFRTNKQIYPDCFWLFAILRWMSMAILMTSSRTKSNAGVRQHCPFHWTWDRKAKAAMTRHWKRLLSSTAW